VLYNFSLYCRHCYVAVGAGILFGLTMIMVSIALVMSVIVTNIYMRKDTSARVPRCLRRLLLHHDDDDVALETYYYSHKSIFMLWSTRVPRCFRRLLLHHHHHHDGDDDDDYDGWNLGRMTSQWKPTTTAQLYIFRKY